MRRIDLDTSAKPLLVHAAFAEICELPSHKEVLSKLERALRAADADFFENNQAFFEREEYDDYLAERSDAERLVQLLRDAHAAQLIDPDTGFRQVLADYGVPKLSGERFGGEHISRVLERLADSVDVVALVRPRNRKDSHEKPELLNP